MPALPRIVMSIVNFFNFQGDRIFVLSDSQHVIKNKRNAWWKQKIFYIAPHIVQREGLPTNEVCYSILYDIVEFQNLQPFKIAPHLSKKVLDKPKDPFGKMQVQPAKDVFCRNTAVAIRTMVKDHEKPKWWLTTAWYVDQVAMWIDFMSSKDAKLSFSLKNEEKFLEKWNFLCNFLDLIDTTKNMAPKLKNAWCPVQKGIMLSTKSVMELALYYLMDKRFDFFMPGRFTGDPAENTFSQTRRKNKTPTCLQFIYIIRNLCFINYMKPVKGMSYQEDDPDSQWLVMLQKQSPPKPHQLEADEDMKFITADYELKDHTEEIILVYILGCMLKRTVFKESPCAVCREALSQMFPSLRVHQLIKDRSYREGVLKYPTELACNVFSLVDTNFMENHERLLKGERQPDVLVAGLKPRIEELFPQFPKCHLELLLRRYIKMRCFYLGMHKSEVLCKPASVASANNSSRSMKSASM